MRKKPNKLLISLILSVILGVGGYFGGMMLFGPAMDGQLLSASIPIDVNGNNLIGNSKENLNSGGFITQQMSQAGTDYFYANFDDGGTLYCQDRNGIQNKLTDFAVANLNFRGDVLVFTDLTMSSFISSSGQTQYINARRHEDIWDAAKTTQGLSYGGNLYTLMGVRSFCEGNLTSGELVLTQVDGGVYQSPVFTENYLVLLPIRSKDYLLVSDAEDNIREIRITQNENESIINFIVMEETAFVQVVNEQTGAEYIVKCDLVSGEIMGIVAGRSLTVWFDRPVFISTENGLVHLWDASDDDEFIIISRLKASGDLLDGKAQGISGAWSGPVFYTRLTDGTYKPVYLLAVPDAGTERFTLGRSFTLGRNFTFADPDGIAVASLKLTIFSVMPSANYQAVADVEKANECGTDCECIERCECGGECGCIHNEIVQEVDGGKEQLYYAGVRKQPWEEQQQSRKSRQKNTDGGTTSGETSTGNDKPQDKREPFEATVTAVWEGFHVQYYCKCGPLAECCGGVCIRFDEFGTGDCECEEEPSVLKPGGDTGNIDLTVCVCDITGECTCVGECHCDYCTKCCNSCNDCNEIFCDCIDWITWDDWAYWYPNWESWEDWEDDYDTAGERAPTARFDDPELTTVDFLPRNIVEYDEFNLANGGSPPPMEKTLLIEELLDLEFTLAGTSTTRYDYILDSGIHRQGYSEMGYSSGGISALIAFKNGNGFIGDRQDTTLRLVFPNPVNDELSVPYIFDPMIAAEMEEGPEYKTGPNNEYIINTNEWKSSRIGAIHEPTMVWYNCDGYLTVLWDDGDRESGLALSLGRDADGGIVGHGWYIGTDFVTARRFTEVIVRETGRKAYVPAEPTDFSIFEGEWTYKSSYDLTETFEIRDGRMIKYERDGKSQDHYLGELAIHEGALYVISEAENYTYLLGEYSIDGNVLKIGSRSFKR